MAYTPQQRGLIQLALQLSARDAPRVRQALLEAMSVESSFHNLPYGDRDSVGVLQQRPSQGWGPASESPATDITQFLSRARRLQQQGFRGTPGQLAQAVQRSAFPGRYDQRASQVVQLLSGALGRSGGAPSFVPPGQTGVAGTAPVTSSGINPRAMLASALITANQASSQGRPADYSQIAQLVNAARQPVAAPAQQVQAPTGTLRSSGTAGGFLPSGASYKPGRADQGRDFQTAPGGPVIAPGDGVVVAVKSDPNGFGPRYPVVRFVSGPYAGKTLYIGHTLSVLPPGARFRSGQVISRTGTRGVGNASSPGWGEIGYAPGGNPGSFGQRTPF